MPIDRDRPEAGLTLIEMVVASALLAILASAAFPLYSLSIKREREIELRYSLRTMRRAIDDFHLSYVASGGKTDCSFSVGGGAAVGLPGSATPPIGANQPGQQRPGLPNQQRPGLPNQQRPGLPGQSGAGMPGMPGMPGQPSAGAQPGAAPVQEIPLIDVSQFDPCDSRGYPPNLKLLAEGVQGYGGGTEDKDKVKFLRRIPRDPLQPQDQNDDSDDNYGWGVRAYQDAPDSNVWGRQNVWDVYTKSTGTALDGSKYREW